MSGKIVIKIPKKGIAKGESTVSITGDGIIGEVCATRIGQYMSQLGLQAGLEETLPEFYETVVDEARVEERH